MQLLLLDLLLLLLDVLLLPLPPQRSFSELFLPLQRLPAAMLLVLLLLLLLLLWN